MVNGKILDTRPIKREVLSAEDFLELVKKNPKIIEKSFPQPVKLGSRNFGNVCVEYSKPIYKVAY